MKTGKWLPLAVLAVAAAALDVAAFRAIPFRATHHPPTEALEGETNAEGALRQRLLMMRDASGQIPPDAFMRAKAHADRLRARWRSRNAGAAQTSASGDVASRVPGFRWLGPTSTAGRVRTIAIDPTNPNVIVVGSAGGGIWRSTDAGASWTVSDDFMPALSVSTIVFDPRNPRVLYAGTGEGYLNGDAIRGAGIFKSSDGGVTWSRLPATAPSATPSFTYTNRLAFSLDGSVLLAATNVGVFRSTDDGASFAPTSVSTRMTQVLFSPNAANEALAAGPGIVYYTRDAGRSWSYTIVPCCRVELAYSQSDGSIYASIDQNNGTLYRSFDGGASFSMIGSQGSGFLGAQGWYGNTIWVNPFDANNFVVGGVQLWESRDGGATLPFIDHYPLHADEHVVVADPRFDNVTNKTVYVGTDGGVFRTLDISPPSNNVQWQSLNNGLGVTQFYGADGTASSGIVVGGTQDNGTQRYNAGGWGTGFIGDGGFIAADQYDSRLFYADGQYGRPYGSIDGGANWWAIGTGITDGTSTNFIAPLVIDPNDRHRLYLGKSRLWRTDSANGTSAEFFAVGPASDYISAIAVQRGNSDIVWVGRNGGGVYRTTNGTSTTPSWTLVKSIGGYVTRITLDPDDPNSVFVTRGGFQTDNVWHSPDGGVTWTSAAGSGDTALPPAPVYDLDIDPITPGTLYAATEVGLFRSSDDGATWDVPDGLGPANTRVTETFWMGGTLIVATHGRGVWALDVNPTPGSPALTASPASVTFASQAVGTASSPTTVTLSNSGTARMNVQSVWISGANGAAFALTSNGCDSIDLPPGASCSVQVTFRPSTSGTQSAILWTADTAAGSPHGVNLSGTGTTGQTLPAPWLAEDIGAVGVAGGASYSGGSFTVSGSGADVWNTADAFRFVYQPLTGDGTIVAHVATVQPVAAWTKTGVMIRQALTPDAAHAFMIVSAGKGLAFQRRTAQGGLTTSTSGIAGAAPMWVRVTRAGNVVTAAYSSNGTSWTTVGQDTIQLSSTAYVGLAVSSHVNSQLATATFDQVSVAAAQTLPPGWNTADVGVVGVTGSARASSGTFTVSGAGADVWNAADAFRFAYYPLAGDGMIVARVPTVEYVAAWTKAGVMLRQSLSPDSPHAFMIVSAGKGLAFQRRTTAGGVSTNTSGGAGTAPAWVKLVRAGQSVSAYRSADGVAWTLVGQDTVAFSGQIWAGLAVSSHDVTRAATATFDNVSITSSSILPPGWQHADVGSVGQSGSANASSGTFVVKGAGADVWNTADAFHYAYTTLTGDGQVVARVATVEYVAAWTKAGVMIRGSLDPSSPQAFMLVSAGKGIAFQRRTAQGGLSTSTSAGAGAAPAWVRLVRSGTVISAYWSADGATWTLVGQDTFAISGSVYVGLAVSSHDAVRLATASFDGVGVQ